MGLVEKALKVAEENKKVRSFNKVNAKESPIVLSKSLVFENEQDQLAYNSGWVIGLPGEIYEIMLTRYSSVFMMLNDEKRFDVVRLTWRKGEESPFLKKYRAKNISFEKALEVGNKYINWLKGAQ